MADPSELRQGSIIWLSHAPDPQGRNPKSRPFVIVSATTDIRPGNSVVAVAVTSTFKEPVTDPKMVPMRWNAQGNTETGFRRKCFAKVDWAQLIRIREGEDGSEFDGSSQGNFVRSGELEMILRAMKSS